MLRRRCGVPTLGVIPMLRDLWLDGEDSLALDVPYPSPGPPRADPLEIVVVRLPQISNFTDIDAFAIEPGVSVRYVTAPEAIGRPDLVVIPGSKETVRDLAWFRTQRLDDAIRASGADVLGICAGYQMLGATIVDEFESGAGLVSGLGWLPQVTTRFGADKVLTSVSGDSSSGYQIHHGLVSGGPGWVETGETLEGTVTADQSVRGTTFHGLFEHDVFRTTFLTDLAERRGKRFVSARVSFAAAREARFDRIADAIEEHLDIVALCGLIGAARSA
jgi:adenosylcobyric acid synthase